MGSFEKSVEEYLNLWDKFENRLKKEDLNLSSFSRKWQKFHDSNEENDAEKILDQLKTMKKRKDGLKSIRQVTYDRLLKFYMFLDADYFEQKLLDDEKYSHWFD